MARRICIALGGNALIQPGQKGTAAEQARNCEITADQLVKIVEAGNNLVLTHGNGPQVGAILLQNQIAAKHNGPPEMPLAVCGAESQGEIGYMFAQSCRNAMAAKGLPTKVCCMLTQTIVSANDPAFQNPTKPIGGFMTEQEALAKAEAEHCTVREDAGRGWRVVVPSPQPQLIVEGPAIKSLVDSGFVVVCSGGGGIPVVEENGVLRGISAVIDKDRSAAILAHQMECDTLLILTDVSAACINYRKPNEEKLGRVPLSRMRQLMAEGHFAAGSMMPKIEALCSFVEKSGKEALLTSLDNAFNALTTGQNCTIIYKD